MRRGHTLSTLLLLGFLLGIHDGRIALWQGEDPQPVRVFPYSASALPPEDYRALEKGIAIESPADLVKFLEDFCS